ncbi:ABC transporter permease [Pyxidicoccus parkwayensis]|uniref:ABC transporter permease n=1 Tax=Pyxidicoccus parkwayensis TaxID=2813578 RepID=A0ABX7NSC4_9BACT|nr:ABC transporter permease [Pyxidicoccus parkwaysis]QSQ21795.1 ABC transporter permease [Pyxidicoccus parkwaysis]
MFGVTQDLRLALRQLVRTPLVGAVAIASLAIGLGAFTTSFTLINALFLRPPPFTAPEQLLTLEATSTDGSSRGGFSWPTVMDLAEHASTLQAVGAWADRPLSLGDTEASAPQLVAGQLVSAGFFQVLGIHPALGRLLTREDDAAGAAPVVVLGHGLWMRRFAANPAVLGTTVRLNGQPFTVVGIAPPGFHGPTVTVSREAWVSVSQQPRILSGRALLEARGSHWLEGIARVKDGVSPRTAEAELAALGDSLALANPDTLRNRGIRAHALGSVEREMQQPLSALAAVLFVAAVLILVIACVNVSGVLLARAIARRREIAVRLALGAGRRRVVRQLLTEALLLFVLGGAGGLLLSVWATDALLAFEPPIPVHLAVDLRPDARVLLFAFLSALSSGVLFGLLPSLRGAHGDLLPALKMDVSGHKKGSRLRAFFVVGQLAFTLVLLSGSGLLIRAVQHTRGLELGFRPDGVAMASVDLRTGGLDAQQGPAYWSALVERLSALPGVEAAGLASVVPLDMGRRTESLQVPGQTPPPGETAFDVDYSELTPGTFALLGIPLEQGRDVSTADSAQSQRVAVVNQAFVRRFLSEGSPVGRTLTLGKAQVEVVGVVRDAMYHDWGNAPRPAVWVPIAQSYTGNAAVLLRTRDGDETRALTLLREGLSMQAPGLAPMMARPLREHMGLALLPQKVGGTVAGVLGLVGLLLASLGLYGVVAYAVTVRTRELGIRMALGATGGEVVGLVLRQGLSLALVGVAVGVGLALAVGQALRGMLAGLSPADPLTVGGIALLLIGVAILASWLPARRASRVNPLVALRTE